MFPGDAIRLSNGSIYRAHRLTWLVTDGAVNWMHGGIATVLTRNDRALHDARQPKTDDSGTYAVAERHYVSENGIVNIQFATMDDLIAFTGEAPELVDALDDYQTARGEEYDRAAEQAQAVASALGLPPDLPELPEVPDEELQAEAETARRYQAAALKRNGEPMYLSVDEYRIEQNARVRTNAKPGTDNGAWVDISIWVPRDEIEPPAPPDTATDKPSS